MRPIPPAPALRGSPPDVHLGAMPVPQPFRRSLRRLRRLFRPPPALVVFDSRYSTTAPGIPMDPERGAQVLGFLLDEGLIDEADIERPRPASVEDLRRVHTDRYLASVNDPETLTSIYGTPVSPELADRLLDAARWMTGGTTLAARLAIRTRRVAVSLGGGQHHAEPDRGMGFCVYNDIAIAIERLRARGWNLPVLVVDLDIHDGNGTRAAFADDPSVHTFSIHNATWSDHPAVAATVLPLGSGIEDDAFLAVLSRELPPVVRRHQPALVVYVAGTDPAADDRLGDWRLTARGMLERDQRVVDTIRRESPGAAIAVVLGGGYGGGAWRYTARFVSWLLRGRAIEPPDDSEMILRRYRRVRATLEEGSLVREAGSPDDWGLREADLGLVPEAPPYRFLGRFSHQGLELLLERLGYIERLRELGFREPVVSIARSAGGADTLRIHAGDGPGPDLLLELTLRRSARAVPGFETLYVEWLLLQNPRRTFHHGRPPLPGQNHPGLGMLRETSAFLLLLAEELQLDGVAFAPAHYYMAALGRKVLHFLEPEADGHFRALLGALGGLPFAEASRLLESGAVRDERGQGVSWEPRLMVLPASDRLRARVEGTEHAAAVAAATPRYHLVPVPAGDSAP